MLPRHVVQQMRELSCGSSGSSSPSSYAPQFAYPGVFWGLSAGVASGACPKCAIQGMFIPTSADVCSGPLAAGVLTQAGSCVVEVAWGEVNYDLTAPETRPA